MIRCSGLKIEFAWIISLLMLVSAISVGQVSRSDSTINWHTYDYTLNANNTMASYSLDPANIVQKTFNTIILENEFLKLTLVPEFGGRIVSMIYKPTGHEQLYLNPVGAPYGWWWTGTFYYNWLMIYGGIFPTLTEPEHGKSWLLPWDFTVVKETADTLVVKMSWADDVAFTQFSRYGQTDIECDFIITLVSGEAAFSADIVLRNTGNSNQPYEYWTNIGMAPGSDATPYQASATAGAEMIIPAEKLKIPSWAVGITGIEDPVPGEPNTYYFDKLRKFANWEGSGSAFTRPALSENYWGVINQDNQEGLIRVSANTETPYVKIWTFGYPISSTIDPFNPPPANDLPSDIYFSRPFIELWAGVTSEFNVPAIFPANSENSWREVFVPTAGLSNVTHASDAAVVDFQLINENERSVQFEIFAVTPQIEIAVEVSLSNIAQTVLLDTLITADEMGNSILIDIPGNVGWEESDSLLFAIRSNSGENLLQGGISPLPVITGIGNGSRNAITTSFQLSQNYPNPFNGSTIIEYALSKAANVHLAVYDIAGREVIELVDAFREVGAYSIAFQAEGLASGVYLYRMQVDHSASLVGKMLLIR